MTVWVVGSINLDLMSRVRRFPRPGETVTGTDVEESPGGKGANQAVASARMGAPTHMVGCVGNDDVGRQLMAFLTSEEVDVSGVATVDVSTGRAIVTVDDSGENQIVLAPGANAAVTLDHLEPLAVAPADVVLCQGEIPAEVSAQALAIARDAGAVGILDPAPASAELTSAVAVAALCTPNETELGVLAGRPVDAGAPTEELTEMALRARGDAALDMIVTLGRQGVLWVPPIGDPVHLAADEVVVVDSTGAGDCFAGTMASGLSDGLDVGRSLRRAISAASLSVTRPGAASSMPKRDEVDAD